METTDQDQDPGALVIEMDADDVDADVQLNPYLTYVDEDRNDDNFHHPGCASSAASDSVPGESRLPSLEPEISDSRVTLTWAERDITKSRTLVFPRSLWQYFAGHSGENHICILGETGRCRAALNRHIQGLKDELLLTLKGEWRLQGAMKAFLESVGKETRTLTSVKCESTGKTWL